MIKRGSVLECEELGPHGRPIVAVIGYGGFDWAAYEQSNPDQCAPDLIAQYGDKISKEQALVCFPELACKVYRN